MINTKNPFLIDKLCNQALREGLYVYGYQAQKLFRKSTAMAKIEAIAYEPNVGWAMIIKHQDKTKTVAAYVVPKFRRRKIGTELVKSVRQHYPVSNHGIGISGSLNFFDKVLEQQGNIVEKTI